MKRLSSFFWNTALISAVIVYPDGFHTLFCLVLFWNHKMTYPKKLTHQATYFFYPSVYPIFPVEQGFIVKQRVFHILYLSTDFLL
jgi:hypothetical protein